MNVNGEVVFIVDKVNSLPLTSIFLCFVYMQNFFVLFCFVSVSDFTLLHQFVLCCNFVWICLQFFVKTLACVNNSSILLLLVAG